MTIRIFDIFAQDFTCAVFGDVEDVSCNGTIYFTDGETYQLSSDQDWEEIG